MADFFDNLEPEDAISLQRLSRLVYELQDNRNALLASCGAADEAALLQQIVAGERDEHPGYEQYLAVRILNETREAVRAEIAGQLQELKRP